MQVKQSRGFTLIELTIVVSIIGILAALAVPDFVKMMSKSRQSEAKVLVMSIASAQMQTKLKTGSFVPCPPNPKEARGAWDNSLEPWNQIGFGVSGPTQYQYEVKTDEKGFTVRAFANIDGDPTIDEWTYSSDGEFKNTTNDVNQ